jgi:thiol-disulfide isomerase/thioredoxin
MTKALLLVLSGLGLAATGAAQTLKVGDAAPALKVGKWVKGQPVSLKKGKVYVVEFWATRCAPCVDGIPHLSKLAKRFEGKVTIAGVSVQKWQDGSPNDDRSMVAKFMKTSHGRAMKYNVAVDTPDGAMVKHWMAPADRDSIPCAFVVGKNGRIAYIGDPAGLDTVLASATK